MQGGQQEKISKMTNNSDIGQERQHLTACKQYCLAAGATQGNIAYTQTVTCKCIKINRKTNETID